MKLDGFDIFYIILMSLVNAVLLWVVAPTELLSDVDSYRVLACLFMIFFMIFMGKCRLNKLENKKDDINL